MGSPAWLTGIFAALMLTVATYCAGRLAVARRWQRPTEFDTDAGHVLMGVAMAGMLVARLRILPATTWEAVFGAGAAWFAWQVLQSRRRAPATSWRCLHPAPHLVECAAMLYMFLVLPPLAGRGMAAMSAAGCKLLVPGPGHGAVHGRLRGPGRRPPHDPRARPRRRAGRPRPDGRPGPARPLRLPRIPPHRAAASPRAPYRPALTWLLAAPPCARSLWASPWPTCWS